MVKHTVNDSDRKGARYLLLFSIVILLVMIYFTIGSWPAATEDLDLNATSTFNHTASALNQINDINTTRIITLIPFGTILVGPETLLVIIMMVSGAIGACLFSIWAISHHLGKENDFDYIQYRAWYFTRPFLGAGIAFIFYLLIRGGLLTIGAAVLALNVVVIAGLSGLVGMFSEQALLKLLEVADALFGPSKEDKKPETQAAEESNEAKKAADEAKKRVKKAEKNLAQATEKAEKTKIKAQESKLPKDAEEAAVALQKKNDAAEDLQDENEKLVQATANEKEALEKEEALAKGKAEATK
jgi:hypothetical protein